MTRPWAILVLFLVAAGGCAARQAPESAPVRLGTVAPARMVAIGDVHGNLEGLKNILQRTDLIDENSRWIGGRAVLVQTGDLVDRGKDVRAVLDLLMDLQSQAAEQGGKVIVLLGNHETMHLTGDFNYVSPEAHASFSPPGREAYQQAFGPDGKYGKWLRSLPVAVQVQDIVFMHGGISPEYTSKSLDSLNRQAIEEIRQQDAGEKSAEGILQDEKGPLWFRGLALWNEEKLSYLEKWLAGRRLVVAHTPRSKGEIQARLQGRVFLIDTGMLSSHYAGGQGSALELDGDKVTAIYPGRYQLLSKPQAVGRIWPGPDEEQLPFSSHSQAIDFLRTARVISSKEHKDGVNVNRKLVLEKDGIQAKAIFRFKHDVEEKPFTIAGGRKFYFRDSYKGEVAAYELARMLEIDNLPPAALRTIDGQEGSLQLWLDGVMTEHKRFNDELTPPDQERWDRQVGDMRVFDNLINNTDRHPKNILIDRHWNLWMIDHTRTFGKDLYLPQPLTLKRCSPRLWRSLRRLDEKEVRARLESLLSTEELDALIVRRTKLLEFLQQRFEKVVKP